MSLAKPAVSLLLGSSDYLMTEAYAGFFTENGWTVKTGRPEEADPSDHLTLFGFSEVARAPETMRAIPAGRTAIDFHCEPRFVNDPHSFPLHLLDNITVIIHDHEAESFLRERVRPLHARIVMAPYPDGGIGAELIHGDTQVYVPEVFAGHPWLDDLDVIPLSINHPPVKMSNRAFLAVPEYHPSVWLALGYFANSGLGAVAPGVESFRKTVFSGTLLFDPLSKEDFRQKISILCRPTPGKTNNRDLRVGVVVPMCRKNAPGGAETAAMGLARAFLAAGNRAEVLSTTTDSMIDWNNNLAVGPGVEEGLTVRRFRVDNVDPKRHHQIGHLINTRENLSWTEETDWMRSTIRSTDLDDYLRANLDDYDALFYFPYLYGTTYWTSQVVPEKSFLFPCYHDEPPAYTGVLRQNAQWVRGLFFNTFAEKRLAEGSIGISNVAGSVAGLGVNLDEKGDPDRFREKFGVTGDFLLYVGRLQREKNVGELVDFFSAYAGKKQNGKVGLILAGSGNLKIADDPSKNLRNIGFISEQDKIDAYSACTAFVLPSVQESFSIVMMEAWLQEKPVLAHGKCNVSREHLFSRKCGLLYYDEETFAESLNVIVSDPEAATLMGEAGRKYVLENYVWERVVERVKKSLDELEPEPLTRRLGKVLKESLTGKPFGGEELERRMVAVAQRRSEGDTVGRMALRDLVDRHGELADIHIKYEDFSDRAFIGSLLSRIRRIMTRHLKVNYLDKLESRQIEFNKRTTEILRKLFDHVK